MFSLAALTSSVNASESIDSSDWEIVPSTPYILWCKNTLENGDLVQLNIGDNFDGFLRPEEFAWMTFCSELELYKYCTYEISFSVEIEFASFKNPEYSYNVIDKLPTTIGNLSEQRNSEGVLYNNLFHMTYTWEDSESSPYGYPLSRYYYNYSFSTADGFVDNFKEGLNYICFNRLYQPYYEDDLTGDNYYFDISEITATVRFDPEAEYFTNKVIRDLNATAAELDDVQTKLSEAENWLLNKAKSMQEQNKDAWQNSLNQAAMLVSPARSNTTILEPLRNFNILLTQTTLKLPTVLQTLLIACPVLMFIAWLIGRK